MSLCHVGKHGFKVDSLDSKHCSTSHGMLFYEIASLGNLGKTSSGKIFCRTISYGVARQKDSKPYGLRSDVFAVL